MSSLRRACLCLLLRYYIRADDLDEEDLFDLDGEGDYEDPESYIEYDQALYYDGPDDYYDGIEQFNMEDMADYPGEVSPELLEKIFGENPASGDELDALFEELGLGPEGVLYADDGYGEAFFDDEHPDQHKSTVKLVEPELGDVEEGINQLEPASTTWYQDRAVASTSWYQLVTADTNWQLVPVGTRWYRLILSDTT